jgi:nucleoside-diphosphate-sugar epimerase
MSRPLAAVTGSTGFLGVHLVRALREAGFQVRALARREPAAPGWGAAEPEVVAGDLSDAASLERLVDGAAVVVHVAGAIRAPDLEAFMAVNRDGSARLADATLARAPDARFVAVSSLAAREPAVSAYGASKRAGEEAAAERIAPARLTVVRPPAIYGPGDRETLTIFQAAASSPILPVLSPRARLALIHVEDAAAAIAALAARPAPGVFALADGRPAGYGWREIVSAAAAAVGRRPVLAPVPGAALPLLAQAGSFLARMNGKAPLISADKVGELMHPDWAVSATELPPERPQPRYGLESGFGATVSWYRDAGWLR